MGYMDIDGQIVIGGTIDGQEITEVSIDGCTFGFEKLMRTGFFVITDGSGSYNLDLTDANHLQMVGVRFRGRAAVTTVRTTDLGNASTIGPTYSTSYICKTPSRPSVPSAPYGCVHSAATGWSIQVCGIRAPDNPYGYCVKPGYISGDGPCSTANNCYELWGFTTSTANAIGCVRSRSDGYGAGGTTRARTRYNRTCYSADTTINWGGGITGEYPFIISQNIIVPNDPEMFGVVVCPDETEDLFYGLPLPNLALTAGEENTINITLVRGSGNVDIEIFVLYR